MQRLHPFAIAVGIILGLGYAACGGNPPPKLECTGDCVCTDQSCTCEQGGTCTFGPEGGADGGSAESLPSDVSIDCGNQNTCDLTCGTNCEAQCSNKTVCEGSCGAGCETSCTAQSSCNLETGADASVQCVGTSDCSLTTGPNSTIDCGGGSTCTVQLEPSSTLNCTGTSTCDVTCLDGGCTLVCDGTSKCTCAIENCTLECGGAAGRDAGPIECNGKLACPTAMGQCPM